MPDNAGMTTDTHRILGWNDDTCAADWSALTHDEVQAMLAGFPTLHGPLQVRWHSPRPFAAAARVDTPGGTVFVKRHHCLLRTPATLGEEHAFIAHLRAAGLPVPQVLADADGRSALARGDWVYEVQAPVPGTDLYRQTPSWTPLQRLDHARHAGRMLAHLHQAAQGFSLRERGTRMLVASDDLLRAPDLLAAIEMQCTQRPALAGALATRDWRRALAPLLPRHRRLQPRIAGLPTLWTHGDWHASNLLWNAQGEVAGIIDFGLCAPTFALYDLATAIERNAVAWLHLGRGTREAWPHTACALLRGYAEVRPLAAADTALLADLLPLVHLDFALSELAYFDAVLHAPAQAELAWSGFLLGHAAWFDGTPGQALLAAIRDCTGPAGTNHASMRD